MVSPLTTLSSCHTRASPISTTRCSRSWYSARRAAPRASTAPGRRRRRPASARRARSRSARDVSLVRRSRERRADATRDGRGLVLRRQVERGAAHHGAIARERDRLIGPQPLRAGAPANDVGIHAHPVAGGDDDVLADLDVLRLLIEVALLAENGPGTVLVEDLHDEIAQARAALLLVHEGLLRAQLPAHTLGDLFEIDVLDPQIGGGGRGPRG